MGIPYRISKSLLGDKVHYKCPACNAELTSKFGEIGSSDYCPICGDGFTVPGEEEVHKREGEKQKKEAEKQKRDEENRKRQEEANRQIVPARPVSAAIQPRAANLPKQVERPVQTVVLTPVGRVSGETKLCPFCSEEVLLEAKKCKHCGEIIDITLRAADEARGAQETSRYAAPAAAPTIIMVPQAPAPVVTQITNVNVGTGGKRWSPIVAMFLSLIIPGLGQMYKGQTINGLVWLVLTVAGYFFLVIPGLILHLLCILGAGMGNR